MIAALLVGAGVGLGCLLVARGLRPPRPALEASLARLQPGRATTSEANVLGGRLEVEGARLGQRMAAALDSSGLRLSSTRSDLAVTGKPLERFYLDKVLFAVLGLVLFPAVAAAAGTVGLTLPVILPVWISLVFGVGGFLDAVAPLCQRLAEDEPRHLLIIDN